MKDIDEQAINFNTYYTGPGATGPAPLIRNVNIRNVQIDGVPTAISLVGLPEKWLENITLRDIKVTNAGEGARFTRVKNLALENIEISSTNRAMIAEDVYELSIKNVTLSDSLKDESTTLQLKGEHTGAVYLQNLPINQVEFSDGLSREIVNVEPE